MKIAICINGNQWRFPGPKKDEVVEIESVTKGGQEHNSHLDYYLLSGWNHKDQQNKRVSYLVDHFREIEFPPSLMLQVTEALERELVHVH